MKSKLQELERLLDPQFPQEVPPADLIRAGIIVDELIGDNTLSRYERGVLHESLVKAILHARPEVRFEDLIRMLTGPAAL